MNSPNFFSELKRRNVYKVAVAYAVVGWLVIQIGSTVLPTFHTPEWATQTLVVLVILGFPIALVLAWAFEITPEGAWSYLGLTDAMLGRHEDAIREGKRACEILPYTKDSWTGSNWIRHLATIYTWCGEKEAALEQLETSARLPVGITYGELKQSPDWDALRDDARFDQILASLASKN